jgi:exodeoxyribonuclease V alpha subunit
VTDPQVAVGADGLLREFNEAGVLAVADVRVAQWLCELAGERDETIALAAALAVRAPRLSHVHVDLASIAQTAAVESEEPVDLSQLPWPDAEEWIAAVEGSDLLAGPLRLDGSRLYLDRYWREERQVARDLIALAAQLPQTVDEAVLDDGLKRLFGDERAGKQALAAITAIGRHLTVVAGGPGTGKTTTVARVLALLLEQPADRTPLIALTAPTGKAAARMEEAIHEEAARLDISPELRTRLLGVQASTLHRLLGRRPGSHSRFRHDRMQRLPHDVVIVDETSMVSLSLMARLVEAMRPDARLVLVGDPGQLASVEAGAVLGDIVGDGDRPGTVVLDRVHRFRGTIAKLSEAIRLGDADAVLDLLRAGHEDVTWIDTDAAESVRQAELAPVRDAAVEVGRRVLDAARAGDAPAALHALAAFRILCAHRRGPHGVSAWTAAIESWLGVTDEDIWYPGRPLLVTANDYELRLYNGDTGVVVAREGGRVAAAFERRGEVVEFTPLRLGAIDTVHAMTIHKSQGSQFETAAVLLPEPTSRILTRELLYTAATRARERLLLVGTEQTIRIAVERPVARASGLRDLLSSPGS